MSERMWVRRLRWRLRGATMWPSFVLAVVVDAVLMHVLPIAGDTGPELFPAILLAGFFNLAVVAAAAPLAGRWLRRHRPDLPKVVAGDRAGTTLLGILTVALLAIGLAHRPAVRAQQHDFDAQAISARRFVLKRAPREFRRNVGAMNTWKQGPELYRTCVPGPDSRRAFCVIVFTDQNPPAVMRDPDQRPNETVAGPANPGRQSG